MEVIVVPNGKDTSWEHTIRPWARDEQIRVLPCDQEGASAARNHGMAAACGSYVRFLDDDDYLLPAAAAQSSSLLRSGADVCSGPIANVDEDGADDDVNNFPAGNDFVAAVAAVSGLRLPHASLWRREAIVGCEWDTSLREEEDYAWQLDLVVAREWQWAKTSSPVGVWFQHRGPRGSSTGRAAGKSTAVIRRLLNLHQQLTASGRATKQRTEAIVDALWHYAHAGFPNHPIYWTRVARQALAIAPTSRPPDRFYTDGPFSSCDPLLAEWALLPLRQTTRLIRDVPQLWRGRDYRRRL